MLESTHYRLLEVQPNATLSEIKQSYRRLVKLFHPDLQPFTSDCTQIIRLNAAYEVLSDSSRRQAYDAQLQQTTFPQQREQRRSQAQQHYQKTQPTAEQAEWEVQLWIREIYLPMKRLFIHIINPLNEQIDDLAADPFDDRLMENFLTYLDYCRILLETARHLFASRPNPAQVAQIAANIYYCLNHLGDGLEDFRLFTLGYDDRHLHTGQELWRLAQQRLRETQQLSHNL